MTTATTVQGPALVIYSCDDHGTAVCHDLDSLNVYVSAALFCRSESESDPRGHAIEHLADNTVCWHCCPEQVIDEAELARG